MFQKSLELLDKENAAPQFQYLITYETHGPYDEKPPLRNWLNDPTLKGNAGLSSALNTYADRMHKLDGELRWYFEKLAKLKDPPVVVLFGDHHPSMSFELPFPSRGGPHQVEGVIAFANQSGVNGYEGEKPIFCLSSLVFRESGSTPTPYFRYVEKFCRTHQFDGPATVTADTAHAYGDFEILGYDRLFGMQYSTFYP